VGANQTAVFGAEVMGGARYFDVSRLEANQATFFSAQIKGRARCFNASRLVHPFEYAMAPQSNIKFGDVLFPQYFDKCPVGLAL
jgi:hypothetical protein